MDNGWYSIVTRPYSTILGPFYVFAGVFGLLILAALGGLAAMAWRDLRLGARVRRTNETVRVLGNSYYALYRVDYEAETYEMIKGSDYVRGRIPPRGDYDSLLKTASEVIEADAYRDFIQSFSCEKIRALVKGPGAGVRRGFPPAVRGGVPLGERPGALRRVPGPRRGGAGLPGGGGPEAAAAPGAQAVGGRLGPGPAGRGL